MDTLAEFVIDMKELAQENDLEFKQCAPYHFHLKGVFLLNIYPTKQTVYVQGTNHKVKYKDLDHLIDLALGEADLKGIEKTERIGGSTRGRRTKLWELGVRKCFVCGVAFNNFEEVTLEHKIPVSKGGSNRMDNLALSHDKCNQDRGNSLSVKRTQNDTTNREEKIKSSHIID